MLTGVVMAQKAVSSKDQTMSITNAVARIGADIKKLDKHMADKQEELEEEVFKVKQELEREVFKIKQEMKKVL